jgi:5-(carboxyamino)imidazole ribonucleotide synthase
MKRVGIIGGGQLAWMMAGAANKLGVQCSVQTPSVNDPAASIAHDIVLARVDDAEATAELAKKCDVITFENEFVDVKALSSLENHGVCFRPRLKALAPLLDKYHQRCYLRDIGLPVPKFFIIDQTTTNQKNFLDKILTISYHPRPSASISSSKSPNPELDLLVVLKARRHGYDGQGTFIIKDISTLKEKLESNITQQNFLIEEYIPFERELAVIAARSVSGEIVIYPVVETQQKEQVCHRVLAPAEITQDVATQINDIVHTLLNNLQAVGIFGIELFLTGDNKVLVNEVAPRTHNSGHFSLDACETSQFEQHLRAVCGLPLGNPALICQSAIMVNLIGYEYSQSDYYHQRSLIEQIPSAHVHWYGKTESRPGRKLGHVTVLLNTQNRDTANNIAQTIESIWYPS